MPSYLSGKRTDVLTLLLRALFLLGLAIPVYGQATQASFVIGNAVGGSHDDICLTLPPPLIDWRAVAVAALGEDFVNKPHPDSLRRHYIREFDIGASFAIASPAPPIVQRTSWLVLHHGGMTEAHPTMLRGQARWAVAEDSMTIKGSEFSGFACAPVRPAIDAAFFIENQRSANWSTTPGPRARLVFRAPNAKAENEFEILIGNRRYVFAEKDYLKSVKQTRLFRRSGRTLLLITFAGMDDTCSDFYSLYEVARGRLRPLGRNSVGCDD